MCTLYDFNWDKTLIFTIVDLRFSKVRQAQVKIEIPSDRYECDITSCKNQPADLSIFLERPVVTSPSRVHAYAVMQLSYS